MKKMLRSEFLCGAVTAAMVQSLAQDYVGREAYVKWTSDNWVSGNWTVPLAAFILVSCVIQLKTHMKKW
jgi:hypothetical protein